MPDEFEDERSDQPNENPEVEARPIANRSRSPFPRAAAVASVIAAMLGVIGSFAAAFLSRNVNTQSQVAELRARDQMEAVYRASIAADRSTAQLKEILKQNDILQREIAAASKGGGLPRYAELSPADRQSVDSLKIAQDQLQTRIAGLEGALLNTPEKALAVPLLKQQLDALQDHTHTDLDAVRGEIARLFGLTQWFIGLMFTIALGVLGVALNNLRRPVEKAKA